MEQFTVNVPVRDVDAEDVKNAFADAYGYKDTIDLGNGVDYPNPVTKEQFVTQCCTGFLLSIFKGYMVENAEAIAVSAASQEASTRAAENVALFDAARLAALPVDPFTNHPTAVDQTLNFYLEDGELTITLAGSDPDSLPLTFEIVENFATGTSQLLDNVISYVPEFTGQQILTYKVFNGTKYSPLGTITVNVSSSIPTSTSQSISIPMNSTATITLTGEDPNSLPLTHSVVESTVHGDLTIEDNVCTYTPFADFVGADSFTFTSSNGTYTSDPTAVTIEVAGE
jgi:hypothetical protein